MLSSPPPISQGDSSPSPTTHALRLTVALQHVLQETTGDGNRPEKPLTLRLIINSTGERAFGVLMAFLCLPFLTPIPFPGLSIPFGIAILLLGAQIAVRKHRPWLPAKLLDKKLPQKFGTKLITFVAKIFRPLERIIRPRLLIMQHPIAIVVVGISLVLDGFMLSLPLPPVIPFSNAIPAWMAMIKILGITETDGISLIVGTTLTWAAAAGVTLLVILSWSKIVH